MIMVTGVFVEARTKLMINNKTRNAGREEQLSPHAPASNTTGMELLMQAHV